MDLLDYSRFVAVILVMAFHYFFNGIYNGKISTISHDPVLITFVKYGYLGVSLFFMISGYVIFFSAKNRTAKDFAVSRALRLFPSFWFAVLLTSSFAYFWGGKLMSVSFFQVLANLTMVAPVLGFSFVDGVYWTLILELNFYFFIFCLLSFGLESRIDNVIIGWPILIFLAMYLGKDKLPMLGGYYSYFAAGSIFAILKNKITLRALFSLGLCFYNCIAFSSEKGMYVAEGHSFSVTVIIGSISMFFIFFFFVNTKFASSLTLPGSRFLGALTYPIYLTHAHIGYMLMTRFGSDENKYIVVPLVILFILIVSIFIYEIIEKKLAERWKLIFKSTLGLFISTVLTFFKQVILKFT